MDEKGHSWPEAMLSLVIIMVIFSSLLPMASHLTLAIQMKKHTMIAAETSFQAAIHYRTGGQEAGVRTHEGRDYRWTVMLNEICVEYDEQHGQQSKCVAYE
ncbi:MULTISPECIES: hypothetical protein [unclassified Sporosarcina]|uniref:hypothetical protein n=1 Tax=unclassified Sporosarcina TaxID=2647733 RepID=UPI00203DD31E|nr:MULTISPECIES: hypothetical protein [unclassified Sporosarcina]GKV64598.1 hypothetical protein NCCP2331_07510 [Sporosarcina sp. NCCP-2331]GLB54529.1 hypothetical protein NCCP2378_03140 [Sporosarcina sp. NCCP-2378]